jgi:hypothetical protein
MKTNFDKTVDDSHKKAEIRTLKRCVTKNTLAYFIINTKE